MKQCLEYPEM